MVERSKSLIMMGTGAILGSVATITLLKLLSRRVGNGYISKRSGLLAENTTGDGSISTRERERMAHNGVKDVSVGGDLLKDEIASEQLTRNIQFFGMESQRKVTESFVVVIGLGGVGSHAASMLLRSGVGRLLLVDFDQVSVSSLNRHAVATREDVGTPKAVCLQKHFASIFPECQIDARVQLYDASSEEEILSGQPDFVLDCIDNIDTKVALLAACVRRGLRVLSATGAGARADPTRIRVADLRESINDPLSRAVRHRLKKDHGIEGGIPVVFSLEKPKAKLLPFKGSTGEEENPSDYQVMASYVVTQLAGLPVQTEPVVNLDLDHYRTLLQRLIEHEEILYGTAMDVQALFGQQIPQTPRFPYNYSGTVPATSNFAMPFFRESPEIETFREVEMLQELESDVADVEEVMYVVKELWHGRSARDAFARDVGRAMWRSVNDLMLLRWDQGKPASVSNLILLKFEEAEEHESMTLDDIRDREPDFFARVTGILKRAELDFGL